MVLIAQRSTPHAVSSSLDEISLETIQLELDCPKEEPLLREWSYSSKAIRRSRDPLSDHQTETPVAVPVNALCSLPTKAAFVATCVSTQLSTQIRRFDTWLQQPPDGSLSAQQMQADGSSPDYHEKSGNSGVEVVLQTKPQEEEEEEDDWEIVEEEVMLVYGEVYSEEADMSLEIYETSGEPVPSDISQRKKKKFKKVLLREFLDKVRVCVNKKRRRFCRHQSDRERHTSFSSAQSHETISSSCHEETPHYNLALTDRSIDDHLESIRKKLEEDATIMNASLSSRNTEITDNVSTSSFRRDNSCENLIMGDIEMSDMCSENIQIMNEENGDTTVPSPPAHRSALMRLPSICHDEFLISQDNFTHPDSGDVLNTLNPVLTCNADSMNNASRANLLCRAMPFPSPSSLFSNPELPKKTKRITSFSSSSNTKDEKTSDEEYEDIVINDTLKVMFVGNPSSGKSDLAKRFVGRRSSSSSNATVSTSTSKKRMGMNIYAWDPTIMNNNINMETKVTPKDMLDIEKDMNINVKFNIWDYTGPVDSHITQELLFSPQALYVLVWDLGLKNSKTFVTSPNSNPSMEYDSDENEEDCSCCIDDFDSDYDSDSDHFFSHEQQCGEEESRNALYQEIDEHVQFWIDCIQRNAPGSTILLIGNLPQNHVLQQTLDKTEIQKRYSILKERLLYHENERTRKMIRQLTDTCFVSLDKEEKNNFLRSLCLHRPQLVFADSTQQDLTCAQTGLQQLQQRIVRIATGRDLCGTKHGLLSDHVGASISPICKVVKDVVKELRREKHFFMDWNSFYDRLNARGIHDVKDIHDALKFLSSVGDIVDLNCKKPIMDVTDIAPYMEQFHKSEENNNTSDYVLLHPNFILEAVSHFIQNKSKLLNESSITVDNVPRISRKELHTLWKSHPKLFKSINKKSATTVSPYQFLEKILIQHKMLIPIDIPPSQEPVSFMVPSLLESVEPRDDFFSYKSNRASIVTLCHSWVFSDQVIPIGFMENVMASIYSAVQKNQHWKVEEIMFWKKALFIHCSNVKLFIRLTDQSSPFCVASNSMSPGTKRLTVSGQGSSLHNGKFIWEEGFGCILNIIQKVMTGYNALKCDEQIICPKCLKHHPITEAHAWSRATVYNKATMPESCTLCPKAHAVNVSFLTGIKCIQEKKKNAVNDISNNMVRFEDVLGGIVLIGVYDESDPHNKRLLYAGSGFVVDKKRGLIVTAAHTLFEMERGRIGDRKGDKIFIGVIPKNHKDGGHQPAVFRYVANIVAQDSSMEEHGICQVDACVLKIVAKNKWDVVDCHGISSVYQEKMTSKDIKKENLVELKVRENCEIEEHVRVLGFSQSGQNIVREGTCLFRNVGCTPGVVVSRDEYDFQLDDGGFCPNKEIRVLCDTYCGESGGPCINQQGEVIGILSRSQPTMSYLVPSSEWSTQVKRVKLRKKRKPNILMF